jgi:hypothetical protein
MNFGATHDTWANRSPAALSPHPNRPATYGAEGRKESGERVASPKAECFRLVRERYGESKVVIGCPGAIMRWVFERADHQQPKAAKTLVVVAQATPPTGGGASVAI